MFTFLKFRHKLSQLRGGAKMKAEYTMKHVCAGLDRCVLHTCTRIYSTRWYSTQDTRWLVQYTGYTLVQYTGYTLVQYTGYTLVQYTGYTLVQYTECHAFTDLCIELDTLVLLTGQLSFEVFVEFLQFFLNLVPTDLHFFHLTTTMVNSHTYSHGIPQSVLPLRSAELFLLVLRIACLQLVPVHQQ